MRCVVELTADAERDLESIYRHIVRTDSRARADHVLDRLVDAAERLAVAPQRGSVPRELRTLGVDAFRQVFFKPYRLIYRIHDQRVVIYVVVDGRRDLQSLLAARLLEP